MQRSFPGGFNLLISPRLVKGYKNSFRLIASKAKQSLPLDCRVAWFLAVTIDR
jgi:hypothetical protein